MLIVSLEKKVIDQLKYITKKQIIIIHFYCQKYNNGKINFHSFSTRCVNPLSSMCFMITFYHIMGMIFSFATKHNCSFNLNVLSDIKYLPNISFRSNVSRQSFPVYTATLGALVFISSLSIPSSCNSLKPLILKY